MYKVIQFFTDLQDNNHPYHAGDTFPREGVSVSEERLQELAGNNNLQKKPLIEKVKPQTEVVEKEKSYTKTDINRMSVEDLRKLAKEQGVSKIDNKSGSELKKILIKKLGL